MLQHESRPYSGKHLALCMMGSRMAWERRTHVSHAKAFVNQLVLPGGVEQWVCFFLHLTWCMLATPTPYRHRRACFFVRRQLGQLSKRMRRSKLNTQTSVALKCNVSLLDEWLRNLVCQLQRVTSSWQTHLRYPECPEQWSRRRRWGTTQHYNHPSFFFARTIARVILVLHVTYFPYLMCTDMISLMFVSFGVGRHAFCFPCDLSSMLTVCSVDDVILST